MFKKFSKAIFVISGVLASDCKDGQNTTGVRKYLENAVQAEGTVRLSWEQAGFHSAFACVRSV